MSLEQLRGFGLLALGAAFSAGGALLSPWPLIGGLVPCIAVASIAAFMSRGRWRVVAVNTAAIGVVLIVAEAVASTGLGRGSSSRPALDPPSSVPAGVVPLLASARAVEHYRQRAAPRSRPESDAWNVTSDAAGLTLRTIGSMYSGPGEHTHWLVPGAVVRVSKLHGEDAIYDVVYSISRHGFRATPGEADRAPSDARRSVLFFGCSYTFGEGVEDADTLPAHVQSLSEGRLTTHNFGIPGGGAHEMLAILEAERERPALGGGRPLLAIYTALGDHPLRAVGGAGPWQRGRPRYELRAGNATRAGTFGDALHPLGASAPDARAGLCRSALLCRLFSDARASGVSPASLELWRGLVRRSRDLLRERYGIPLVTLVWHQGSGDAPALERALAADGIASASTRSLMAPGDPDLRFAFDEHPNPRAYVEVAAAVVDRIADGSWGIRPDP